MKEFGINETSICLNSEHKLTPSDLTDHSFYVGRDLAAVVVAGAIAVVAVIIINIIIRQVPTCDFNLDFKRQHHINPSLMHFHNMDGNSRYLFVVFFSLLGHHYSVGNVT